jgi:hypothetical protein
MPAFATTPDIISIYAHVGVVASSLTVQPAVWAQLDSRPEHVHLTLPIRHVAVHKVYFLLPAELSVDLAAQLVAFLHISVADDYGRAVRGPVSYECCAEAAGAACDEDDFAIDPRCFVWTAEVERWGLADHGDDIGGFVRIHGRGWGVEEDQWKGLRRREELKRIRE